MISSLPKEGLPLTRRNFIARFAIGTTLATLASSTQSSISWAQVIPNPQPGDGILRIRLTDFPVLKTNGGSVRIGTSGVGSDHRPIGLYYPVIINRGPGTAFYAMSAECTHAGCVVPTYNSSAKFSQCPCHGSRYDISGKVLHGPASFPLRSYAVSFDTHDLVTVIIPELAAQVTVAPLVGTPDERLHLTFIGFDQLKYLVSYQSRLATAPVPVNFALTPAGPLDQTIFVGNADYADVYVAKNGNQGWYTVDLLTEAV